MQSSAARKPRASRKGEIPGKFIQKWQSSGTRAKKPLVRRPMTACQACRTAKVKCDGQEECERCTSRGIVCKYTVTETAETLPPHRLTGVASSQNISQAVPEQMSIDWDAFDATNHLSMGSTAYEDGCNNMPDWVSSTTHHPLDNFDWGTIDPGLKVGFKERTNREVLTNIQLRLTCISKDHVLDSQTILPSPLEPVIVHPLPSTATGSLITASPPFQATSTGETTISPSIINSPSQPSQLFLSPRCTCRKSLAVILPQITYAVQEKQFNGVFQLVSKVVKGFQDVVNCMICNVTCTDLICIMAVLKQTGSCFEYIAQADLGGAIKMSFGGHDVPINDPKLRAMLVLALIQHATSVLDAISTKGQYMLQTWCTSPLAHTSIGYLEMTIGDFRAVLRRVADSTDEAGSPSIDL